MTLALRWESAALKLSEAAKVKSGAGLATLHVVILATDSQSTRFECGLTLDHERVAYR